MTITTKTPTKIQQETGGVYRKFNNLDNIKNTNTGSYAISDGAITGKNGAKHTPSHLVLSKFKFGLPSNAVVKKLTVYYRYSKRGENSSHQPVEKDYPNFPKPAIYLTGVDSHKRTLDSPPKKGSKKSLTVKGLWKASDINNLEIDIFFGANTTNNAGYVLFGYLYVTIDWFVPNYVLGVNSANINRVYNGDEYHLKVTVSDSNKTQKVPECNISIPTGLTFKEAKGGKVTKTGNTNLKFIPNMKNGSHTVEIIFDTNFTFSTGQESASPVFSTSLANTSISKSYTGTVYKELPLTEEEGGTYTPIIDDGNSNPENFDVLRVIVDEEVTISIDTSVFEENTAMVFAFPVDANNEPIVTQEDTPIWYWEASHVHNWTWITRYDSRYEDYVGAEFTINHFNENIIKGTEIGKYVLMFFEDAGRWIWSDYSSSTPTLRTFIEIVPKESDLTVPNYARLEPTTEEQNRLGDGYNYTAQTNMKVDTSETYVRNWYKNFRIGVFNNPILANQSIHYQYDNMEDEFDGYFYIPGSYDLTGASLVVTTDHSIILNGETVSSSKTYSNLEEYNVPIHYEKVSDDEVLLGLTLKNSQNQTIWEMDYDIRFNSTKDDFQEITVDTTDYDNLTDEEIFNNAQYWSDNTAGLNTTESVDTAFTYNEEYPLYILITGDYPEGAPADNTVEFAEPCIIESSNYTSRQDRGNYPVPIESLLLADDSSEISLDANNTSETLVFYDLPLDEGYGTDTTRAIRGIELTGNIEQSDRCILYAKLKSPKGDSHERSIIINDYDTTLDTDNGFTIGGNGDLWGFNTLEITNLEQWEIELSIANTLEENTGSINFHNIQLNLYIEEITEQNIQVKIENEDIAYYGAFITDLKVPEGLETDTNYLKVDGTDTNDAYRQNIKEKEIKIEFEIEGCDLEASTLSLRELTKLLVNDRDEFNRPIPKRLELSNYPEVYWEYIMEKPLETDIDVSTYECKATLTIPAGTSYDKNETVTSNTGYVDGLAAVNPVIIVKPTADTVTIKETITGQSFSIGHSNWGDNILEIDCQNRVAHIKSNEEDTDPIKVNEYIDYDSDWFALRGEYAFEGINCIIRTISTKERW